MFCLCGNFIQNLLRNLYITSIFICIFFITPVYADSDAIDRELKIKIAYLYHFSQFTQWEKPLSTLNYCVFNDIAISERVKTTFIDKKSSGSVKLDVHNLTEGDDLSGCQIIFFPHPASKEILNSIYHKPILSVGVQKDFIDLGGIIFLFEEDQKIHFFINNIDAQEANLKMNSQLLALSRLPPQ
ncbi:MAG: hypothetical protein RLZZ66_2330 [Pseudomonadota bacterium]|jgi:hypothetical protein